jgi:hypothetical protein
LESIRRLTQPQLLAGAALLIVVGMAFAYLQGDSDVRGFFIASVIGIAVAAFLLLWLVPREEAQSGAHRPSRTALILGILAVVTLIGFWLGLPFALGVPAVYLGAVGQARARQRRPAAATPGTGDEPAAEVPSERTGGGEALAAAVLGALALVVGLIACVVG